jgi:hypothetical protein
VCNIQQVRDVFAVQISPRTARTCYEDTVAQPAFHAAGVVRVQLCDSFEMSSKGHSRSAKAKRLFPDAIVMYCLPST